MVKVRAERRTRTQTIARGLKLARKCGQDVRNGLASAGLDGYASGSRRWRGDGRHDGTKRESGEGGNLHEREHDELWSVECEEK